MRSLKCIFGHKWIDLLLVVSSVRRLTRVERKCKRCERREIAMTQFSPRVKREVIRHYEQDKEYYTYKKRDWLDDYTRLVITKKMDEE